MPAISSNTDKFQRSRCYKMSMTLLYQRIIGGLRYLWFCRKSYFLYFFIFHDEIWTTCWKIKWKYCQSNNQRIDRATRILQRLSTDFFFITPRICILLYWSGIEVFELRCSIISQVFDRSHKKHSPTKDKIYFGIYEHLWTQRTLSDFRIHMDKGGFFVPLKNVFTSWHLFDDRGEFGTTACL